MATVTLFLDLIDKIAVSRHRDSCWGAVPWLCLFRAPPVAPAPHCTPRLNPKSANATVAGPAGSRVNFDHLQETHQENCLEKTHQ